MLATAIGANVRLVAWFVLADSRISADHPFGQADLYLDRRDAERDLEAVLRDAPELAPFLWIEELPHPVHALSARGLN
jgi:hypothetical protein